MAYFKFTLQAALWIHMQCWVSCEASVFVCVGSMYKYWIMLSHVQHHPDGMNISTNVHSYACGQTLRAAVPRATLFEVYIVSPCCTTHAHSAVCVCLHQMWINCQHFDRSNMPHFKLMPCQRMC